jgi:antitoxin component YwqK of YwqJK toxin-antitoxin module
MKNLLFLFFCLAQIQAIAQSNAPFYYLGDSLNSSYLEGSETKGSEEDETHTAIAVKTYKNCTRATFFEPKSQKILAVVRGKTMPCHGEKGETSVVVDSSFVLKVPNGSTFVFDAATNILTETDEYGKKNRQTDYLFSPKDTTVLVTEFYDNGNIYSTTLYKNINSYCLVLDKSSGYNVQELIGVNNQNTEIQTDFYPNGKKCSICTQQNRVLHWTLFDSTGVMTAQNVRYDAAYTKNKITLLNWRENGQLDEETANKTYLENYNVHTNYGRDSLNKAWSIIFDYIDTLPNAIVYISEKPDGFFRDVTKYAELKHSYFVQHSNKVYPLFEEMYSNNKLENFKLLAQGIEWKHDACPFKPSFVVEGAKDGLLPDGKWSVFFVDTAGKKTTLAVLAEFKKGVPDGRWIALDAAQDTLASAVYKMGILIYNKYEAAYWKQQNPEKYALDSVNKAQNAMEIRNAPRIVQQHALYQKNPQQHIWQRDTLIFCYNSAGYHSYKNDVIVVIKEQLSPDANSRVRLKYFYPKHPTVPISVVLFEQKTLKMDSIAVFYDESGREINRFDAKKAELLFINEVNEFAFNELTLKKQPKTRIDSLEAAAAVGAAMNMAAPASMIGDAWKRINPYKAARVVVYIPNDSTMIRRFYWDKAGKTPSAIHIDSIGLTPTMRAPFWNNQHMAFTLTLPDFTKMQQTKALSPKDFMIGCSDPQDALVHTQTVDFFDKNGLRYETEIGGKTIQYAADGKTIVWDGRDPKYSGVLRQIEAQKTTFYTYKNGQLNGESITINLSDSSKNVKLFKNSDLQKQQDFDRKGRLLKELKLSKILPKAAERTEYNENGEIMHHALLLTHGGTTIEDLDRTESAEFYAMTTDSLPKRYLAGKMSRLPSGGYDLKSWYPSGKPQVERAFLSEYSQSPFLVALQEGEGATFDFEKQDFNQEHDVIILHENGKLLMQGAPNINIYCMYDEKGNIQIENIGELEETRMSYPKANETETCHWEKLPYQEGEMQNGHRVGTWRGYFRKAKKQLQYVINYDKEGYLDGVLEIWDSTGQRFLTENYQKNKLNGKQTYYSDGKISATSEYKTDELLTEKKYTSRGKLFETTTIIATPKGSIKTVWEYNDGKSSRKTITIQEGGLSYTCDSIFNKKGKLLRAALGNVDNNALDITYLDSDKKYRHSYEIDGIEIFKTQAAYLEYAPKDAVIDNTMCNTTNKPFLAQRDTLLSRLKDFKYLRFSPALTKNEFRKTPARALNANFEDAEEDELVDNSVYKSDVLQTPTYTISDAFGQSFTLVPRNTGMLHLSVETDSAATPVYYNPITSNAVEQLPCGGDNRLDADVLKILAINKKMDLRIYHPKGMSSVFRFPPRLLHPAESPDSAVFVFSFSEVEIIKTFPHQYSFWESQDADYTTKPQQIAAYAAFPVTEYEYISAMQYTRSMQLYGIGNTSLYFVPTQQRIINSVSDQMRSLDYDDFPHHQVLDKAEIPQNDTFLNQKKIRVLCPTAYLRFAPLIPQPIAARNILIDNTEISLNFPFYAEKINPKVLQKQCAAQHIDLIITTEGSIVPLTKFEKEGQYVAHLRWR